MLLSLSKQQNNIYWSNLALQCGVFQTSQKLSGGQDKTTNGKTEKATILVPDMCTHTIIEKTHPHIN